MKNHELIAKVGGIEKAQEIVAGVPENTQMIIPCLDGVVYFSKRGDGKWFKWSDGYSQWLEYFGSTNPMDLAISLSDLRTAIAEHDAPEFKVGDLVCYIAHSDNRLYKIKENHVSHGFVVGSSSDREFWTMFVGEIRHATPSEIKAGHRELLGNSEQLDEVADIGYHVSPSCVVVNHE